MKLRTIAALGCVGVILSACGGGGGTDSTAATGGSPSANGGTGAGGTSASGTGAPASAFQSTDAFIAYVTQLVAGGGDTTEPLTLPDGAAPTSDTTEPSGA